jgi:hypothetical protein
VHAACRLRPHAIALLVVGTLCLPFGVYGLVMALCTIALAVPVAPLFGLGMVLYVLTWRYVLGRPLRRGPAHLWQATAVYNGLLAVAYGLLGGGPAMQAIEMARWAEAPVPLLPAVGAALVAAVAAHAWTLDREAR